MKSPDGAPVAGARVSVAAFRVEARCVFGGSNEPPPGAATQTAADGTFDVAFETDDRVNVAVDARGFATWTADFANGDVAEPIEISLAAPRALTGRVVRAGTGTGVAGLDVALVRDVPHDERESDVTRFAARVVATTAADGTFRAEGVAAGKSLRVSGQGWITTGQEIEAPAADDVRIEIQPALDLAGRAEFADGGACGRVAVTVYATDPAAKPDTEAFSRPVAAGGDGRFECGELPGGSYWLEFAGGSPQVVRRIAGPFDAGTRDLRVRLVLGRTIRGRVLRPDGTPAKDVPLKASPEGRAGPDGEAVSDSAGAFAIGGLDAEAYTVACEEKGCFAWTKAGVRAPGEPIEVRLDEGLAVAGVLRDAKGGSLNFVHLTVEPVEAESPAIARSCQTGASGEFRVTALTRGRWRVKFESPDDTERLPEVVVEAGNESVELRTVAQPPKDE